MKIVLDNNIVLDAILERKPFNKLAELIMTACADTHKGYISANSLTDIFYALRKTTNSALAKATIKKLMELFEIINIDAEDCFSALALPMDDFEDALIAVCAKKVGTDYIITRDIEFIKADSPVKVVSPEDFLSIK